MKILYLFITFLLITVVFQNCETPPAPDSIPSKITGTPGPTLLTEAPTPGPDVDINVTRVTPTPMQAGLPLVEFSNLSIGMEGKLSLALTPLCTANPSYATKYSWNMKLYYDFGDFKWSNNGPLQGQNCMKFAPDYTNTDVVYSGCWNNTYLCSYHFKLTFIRGNSGVCANSQVSRPLPILNEKDPWWMTDANTICIEDLN